MRIKRIIYFTLAITASLTLMSSCEEEGDSPEENIEQELRFFNIYQSANYPEAESHPSGLYYLEHTAGDGDNPGPEDWVLVNHVSYTIPDDIIYDTYIETVAKDIRQYDAVFDSRGSLRQRSALSGLLRPV